VLERFEEQWRGKTRAQLDARREACIARAAQLGDYEHPSQAQRQEFDALTAETIVIDGLIKADDVKIRRAKIEAIARTAADESNLERPYGQSGPALVQDARRDRRESAAEIVTRSGNPWRAQGGGPLAGHTTYGGIGGRVRGGRHLTRARRARRPGGHPDAGRVRETRAGVRRVLCGWRT
jgi:hypothetical protein